MSMRWRGAFLVALLGFFTIFVVAGDRSRASLASLLQEVNGADPAARLDATREMFRRGPAIVGQLESAGAKPMSNVSPRRGDAVYSLLSGDLSLGNAAPTTFGLHVEGGVSANEVERMGRIYGFRLLPSAQCLPEQSPSCYVQLLPGKRLVDVLRDILTTESQVRTVNLNHIEH